MDREAGSYIVDKDGNLIPNEDDEAMAERHGLKKKDSEQVGMTKREKKKEVKEDGGYSKVSE